ncbi:HNH endonuclease signature motif containing protein [Microbacterium lacticum]|uniref:HNH endonuclease signature motif containing protein n=1 Tax=Microbacterium lacticum TaxID=33885 RepID=UPI001F5ABAFC|nr:HNH endonuclease signature motif containing protein [Microbacterium lacticum]
MSFFTDMQAALDALRGMLSDDADAAQIPYLVHRLADDGVVALIASASVLVRGAESLRIAGSGAVAARSTRESGHTGLAQARGHRSPTAMVQELTGTTRADAARQVRLGETLLSHDEERDPGVGDDPPAGPSQPVGEEGRAPMQPWHTPLGAALLRGTLTSAQHDAIFRGLGEPPSPHADDAGQAPGAGSDDAGVPVDIDGFSAGQQREAITAAWSAAAAQLVDEAASRTVEELGAAARAIRDMLDPAGAQRRFDERFEARSFRMWTDRDGIRRASFVFDDVAAAWVASIIDTALRPRRGGPRFVGPDEKERADELIADPRTNDQLAYDLVIDVLRAGALADHRAVFGARQAGVRLVLTADAALGVERGAPAVGIIEDDGATLPAWLVAQHARHTGTTSCTIDGTGNPLDVGREHRLFTAKQRIALALRDGGCRWKGCDRPASYCEAHHIDQWHRDAGRTDVDRGILLCRFHHMQLHHGGWRITRESRGDFLLHPPGGAPPETLPTRLARRYAWGEIEPPPRRMLPAA